MSTVPMLFVALSEFGVQKAIEVSLFSHEPNKAQKQSPNTDPI